MAGYARQSSSSIQDGETITAAPLNSEFDAVLAAFAFSGGHNHDGSSTEGAYVSILADVDALNKIVVDTTNNRHGFFVEVSSSAVEQIRIQDGAIVPVTSNDIDLGTSSLQYKDIHIDGTAYIDTLEIHVGASLSAGVLSLPDGSASAPVITNTGDTNQGLYFSGTDEMSFTAGGTAQVTFADGVIKPVTDNDVDLGTSSLQFKDIHINGTANIDTLAGTTMSGNLAMGSNSITGLAAPSADGDAARKVYVDDSIASAEGLTQLAGNINVNGFHFFGSSGEDVKFKPQTGASVLSTQDTDGDFVALVLRNESDASDTTGIASLRFDLEDTGGNTVDAAKIAVKKEQTFTATASSQDSKIVFSTSLNGTLTEYLELSSAGALVPVTNNTVDIGTSSKQIKDLYVDGTAYIDAIGFGTTSVTLPTSDGSANQILKTNGSGTISWANDTGTTINNATENELVTVSSTTTQLDGEANLTFDGTTLTLNGKLAMASNTAGKLLIADGTDFEPTAVGDLSEISSVASDDVLIALDTSGGGLKKITRANLVSGLATSSAITNVVEDTTPQLGGDLDAQGKDITDVGILSADASAGIYGATGSPVVFTVTVASKTSAHPYNGDGSSSGYFLNGVESPALKLHGADSVTSSSGYYYKFDQAEGTNSGHPLRFYLDAAKTIAYTTGVTTSGTPGTAGAHTTIAVTDQTPSTLYYQCSSHGYMGNYASVDSANITSSGAVTIDAVGDVTLDADGGDILFKDAGTTFGSATNTSGNLILKSGTTTALTFSGANATVAGNLIVTGDHTVNGTTTTVNSTTVTIDDPIFTLGGDGTPGSDDNKDRGIEFRWHDGSGAKVGFFGYDDSASAFTFVPDATNSSEVFSGSVGNVIFGNVTGTLQTAAQTNITSVGALDGGSITSGFGAIDNGTSGIRTNTFTAETSVVPDSSGGADLGSTSLEWGDLYIADDKKIYLGSDQNFSIEYDEDGNDTTAVVAAGGVSLAPHGTSTGNNTELRFQELAANGANYVGFKAPDAISSNEVWVLPNADGSDGQVLKTDGSNALTWVDQASGGVESLVADGAITAGKPVILTSAGKAKQVVETATAFAVGTSQEIATASSNDDYQVVYDTYRNKALAIYRNGASPYNVLYKVGTIDTSANSITWGTAGNVNTTGAHNVRAVYDEVQQATVVFYNDNNTSPQTGKCLAITLDASGNATVGSTATFSSNPVDSVSATYAQDVGAIVAYDVSSGNFESRVVTVSGTTVTLGTAHTVTTNEISKSSVAYDTTNNKVVVVYGDATNSYYSTYAVGSISGTTVTYETPVVFISNATPRLFNNYALVFDKEKSKFIYNGYTSDTGTVYTGSLSDTTVTWGSAQQYSTASHSQTLNYNPTTKSTLLSYRNTSTNRPVARSILLDVNGTATFGTETDLSTINATGNIVQSNAAGAKNIASFVDNSNTNFDGSVVTMPTAPTTNLTSTNFLGIAAQTISDTATGKITIPGGVNANQSSLTIGAAYFTSGAGAVGTSGIQFIGRAISATQLQVAKNQLTGDGSNIDNAPGNLSIDLTVAGADAIAIGDLVSKESDGTAKKIKKTTTTTNYDFAAVSAIQSAGSGINPGTTYQPDNGGKNMAIGGSTDGRFLCIYNAYWQVSYDYQYTAFVHTGSGSWTTTGRASIGIGANQRMQPRVRWISNLNAAAGGTFLAAFLTANGWKHTVFTMASDGSVSKHNVSGSGYWIAPNDSTSTSSTNFAGDTTVYDTSTDDATEMLGLNRVSGNLYVNRWTLSWSGSAYTTASVYRTGFSGYTTTTTHALKFVRLGWDFTNNVGIAFCLDSSGHLVATKFTLGNSAATRTYLSSAIYSGSNSINDNPRAASSLDGHGQVFFAMQTENNTNSYSKYVWRYNTTGDSPSSSYLVTILSGSAGSGSAANGSGVPHMSYDFISKKLFVVSQSSLYTYSNYNWKTRYGINNTIRVYTFTGTTQDSVTEVSNSGGFDASSDSAYTYSGMWAIPDTMSVSSVTDAKGGYWMGIYIDDDDGGTWDTGAELKTGVLPHSLTTNSTNKSSFYGVAETAGAVGKSIKVIGKDSEGIIHNRSGLSSGTKYYVSDTGTAVTTTTGGTDIDSNVDNPIIGQAISKTDIRFPSVEIAVSGGDPKVFCGAVDFRRDSGVGTSVILSKPDSLTASEIRAYEIHFYGVGTTNDATENIRFKPYKNGSSVMTGETFSGTVHGSRQGGNYYDDQINYGSYLTFRFYNQSYPYRANSAGSQNYDGNSYSGKLTAKVIYENNFKNAAYSYEASVRTGASNNYVQVEHASLGSKNTATTTDYAEQFYFYASSGAYEEGVIVLYAIKK